MSKGQKGAAKDSYSELISEMQSYLNDNFDEVISFSGAIAYEGFDHRQIIKSLKSKEPNIKEFRANLIQLITVFVCRGNNVKKILESMTPEGKSAVEALVRKYSISPRVQAKSDITLSRISACFPQITLQIRVKGVGRQIIEVSDSNFLTSPSFASLVPREREFRRLILALGMVSLCTSDRLNKTDKNDEVTLGYLDTQLYSKVLTRDQKLAALQSCGVITASGNMTTTTESFIEEVESLPGAISGKRPALLAKLESDL